LGPSFAVSIKAGAPKRVLWEGKGGERGEADEPGRNEERLWPSRRNVSYQMRELIRNGGRAQNHNTGPGGEKYGRRNSSGCDGFFCGVDKVPYQKRVWGGKSKKNKQDIKKAKIQRKKIVLKRKRTSGHMIITIV